MWGKSSVFGISIRCKVLCVSNKGETLLLGGQKFTDSTLDQGRNVRFPAVNQVGPHLSEFVHRDKSNYKVGQGPRGNVHEFLPCMHPELP